jgi:hypothetical protein
MFGPAFCWLLFSLPVFLYPDGRYVLTILIEIGIFIIRTFVNAVVLLLAVRSWLLFHCLTVSWGVVSLDTFMVQNSVLTTQNMTNSKLVSKTAQFHDLHSASQILILFESFRVYDGTVLRLIHSNEPFRRQPTAAAASWLAAWTQSAVSLGQPREKITAEKKRENAEKVRRIWMI